MPGNKFEELMEEYIGERITLWGGVFFYHGTLVAVEEEFAILEDVYCVFDTGPLSNKEFQDAGKLADRWLMNMNHVESFGIMNKKTK